MLDEEILNCRTQRSVYEIEIQPLYKYPLSASVRVSFYGAHSLQSLFDINYTFTLFMPF